MTDDRIIRTATALAPLWGMAPPMPQNFYQHPDYLRFKSFCVESFASADRGLGFSFVLADALRSVGLPCLTNRRAPSTIDEAARTLVAGFDATTVRSRYLCPLNNADDLPEMRFGAATVRRYSPADLATLFDEALLMRFFPDQTLDRRLSAFQWLVVEDVAPVAKSAGRRAFPHLYDWSRDLGAVDPHAGNHPGPVLAALFGLLLAPWEDWHSNEYDWRSFSIPWIHVASDDPFIRPKAVPAADTLDWEDACYPGDDGEPIEIERPLQLPLYSEAEACLSGFDQTWWARIEAARATSLFETPVEHFLVRAALSNGIDQIMAHMTAIEAAIGLQTDFSNKGRHRSDQMTATKRMAKRVGRLLCDAQAESDYAALFEIRSGFVHGRAIQTSIPSKDRDMARRLARRVTLALIDAANGPARYGTRADYLNSLA